MRKLWILLLICLRDVDGEKNTACMKHIEMGAVTVEVAKTACLQLYFTRERYLVPVGWIGVW